MVVVPVVVVLPSRKPTLKPLTHSPMRKAKLQLEAVTCAVHQSNQSLRLPLSTLLDPAFASIENMNSLSPPPVNARTDPTKQSSTHSTHSTHHYKERGRERSGY